MQVLRSNRKVHQQTCQASALLQKLCRALCEPAVCDSAVETTYGKIISFKFSTKTYKQLRVRTCIQKAVVPLHLYDNI